MDNHYSVQHGDRRESSEPTIKREPSPLFEPENTPSTHVGRDSILPTPAPTSRQPSEAGTAPDMRADSPAPAAQHAIAVPEIGTDGMIKGRTVSEGDDKPRLAIYHSSFAEAEKLVEQVCQILIRKYEMLKAQGYHHPEIENILEDQLVVVSELWRLYPTLGPAAFLGPAGVGKSSTMNCILGQRNAALESGGTTRGTSLPHEYAAASDKQTEPYRVEVALYTEQETQRLVTKYIKDIIVFGCLDEEEQEVESETSDYQQRYDTGIAFFHALLADQRHFHTEDDVKEYFEEYDANDIPAITEELLKKVKDFMKSAGLKGDREVVAAHDEEELLDIFGRISRPPKSQPGRPAKSHPWPLVRKVTVMRPSELLSAGLKITDLPGVADTNQAVVDSTTEYLKQADTIFVFTTGSRSSANEILERNLLEGIRLGKMRNMYLIVTKIDDANPLTDTEERELSKDDRETYGAAKKCVEGLQTEHDQLNEARNQAITANNLQLFAQLTKEMEAIPARRAILQARIGQVVIDIRNREIEASLAGMLRTLSKVRNAPDLKYFFIGNKAYQKHILGYYYSESPSLDFEGTGIPGLRRLLFGLPGRGKLHILTRIARSRLPNIVNGFIGVLTKPQLERKQQVEKEIVCELRKYKQIVDGLMVNIHELLKVTVLDEFASHKDAWTEEAADLLDDWETYRANVFQAFSRKAPKDWRMKRKGEGRDVPAHIVNWHVELHSIFEDDVSRGFRKFADGLDKLEIQTSGTVRDLFGDLKVKLEDLGDFQGTPGASAFFEYLLGISDRVTTDFASLFAELRTDRRGTESMEHNATDGFENSNSLVALAMAETHRHIATITAANYQAAEGSSSTKKKKGSHSSSGAHQGRVDYMRKKFRHGVAGEKALIPHVSDLCKTSLDNLLEDSLDSNGVIKGWKSKVMDLMAAGHDDVLKDFRRRFAVSDVKVEENPEAEQALLEAANEALAIIEGPLRARIDELEDYEKIKQ